MYKRQALFLPNVEGYSNFVSEQDKPGYFNVSVSPLNDACLLYTSRKNLIHIKWETWRNQFFTADIMVVLSLHPFQKIHSLVPISLVRLRTFGYEMCIRDRFYRVLYEKRWWPVSSSSPPFRWYEFCKVLYPKLFSRIWCATRSRNGSLYISRSFGSCIMKVVYWEVI